MDFFTHALLLYLLGRSLHLERKLLAALVLGGVAPDLDVFLSWVGGLLPPSLLLVHRGITHSFFFGFLFGLLILYLATLPPIRCLFCRLKDYDIEMSSRSVLLVLAGVAIHLLLDYSTTRGAPLFYPLQTLRYSADLFYQIEPVVLAAAVAILAALIIKRSLLRYRKILFVIFLVFLLLAGGIRLEGKEAAEEYFSAGNASFYPGPGLFTWAALEETGYEYRVTKYNCLERNASIPSIYPRMKVASSSREAQKALDSAEGLSQVKLFRWRAYAVAVNASSSGSGTWWIEYFDPLVLAQREDSWAFLRPPSPRYGSLKVAVESGVARVVD